MRISFRLGVIALCLLAPSIAAADDSGLYLGFNLGPTLASRASYSTDVFPHGLNPSPDFRYYSSLDSAGGDLEAGYWFTPYIGEQISIVDLGQYSALAKIGCPGAPCGVSTLDSPRIKARGATLALTGRLPLSNELELVGRAGLLWSDTTYDEDVGSLTSTGHFPESHYVKGSASGVYGVSLGWNFKEHWEALLGWDLYTGLGGDRFNTFNVNLLSLGIQYHF
jgi:hypothetical protein